MKRTLHKILLVEDDEDIRTIAQIALEDIGGFTVQYCCSGIDALQRINDFQPDLIVLDVMMPEMDGPTTLAKLQQAPQGLQIPVVFMTAKAQAQEIAYYRSLGVVDVITKPFDPLTLAQTLHQCWEKYYG